MKKKPLEKLDPVSFGFVMATGSVSIAFFLQGWLELSGLFFIIATLGYLWLILIFLTKLCLLGKGIIQEIIDIQNMFKYLTFSAGSNVLAARFCFAENLVASIILGILGTLSAVGLIYLIFYRLFFHEKAPIQSVSPFWLLLCIACNSVGIELTLLWEHELVAHPLFLLFSFGFWTFGVVTYLIFMTLNLYRMFFLPFVGRDINPAYWTCMGAAAIAVVDGSRLLVAKNAPQFLVDLEPFIRGGILLLWCWGSAWIPILILMGVCKHVYFKLPFYYEPALWAIVFPLGMYTMATASLGQSVHLDLVQGMTPVWLWIAALTWLLFFVTGLRKDGRKSISWTLRLFESA